MGHLTAPVPFIQEASMNQRAGMLGDGLKIGAKFVGDLFNRYALISLYYEQNSNTSVVGGPLEVTLQLFWCFHHISIVAHLSQHSNILQNVGVL